MEMKVPAPGPECRPAEFKFKFGADGKGSRAPGTLQNAPDIFGPPNAVVEVRP